MYNREVHEIVSVTRIPISVSDSETENSPVLELLQSNHRSKYRDCAPHLTHAKRHGNRIEEIAG
jgi:hypothetical protein